MYIYIYVYTYISDLYVDAYTYLVLHGDTVIQSIYTVVIQHLYTMYEPFTHRVACTYQEHETILIMVTGGSPIFETSTDVPFYTPLIYR